MNYRITLYLVITGFITVLYLEFPTSSANAQDRQVPINTMDLANPRGETLEAPSFTITKSYTIIKISIFYEDKFLKPNPKVEIGILNSNGIRVCRNTCVLDTDVKVRGSVMSARVNCILSPGTYTI